MVGMGQSLPEKVAHSVALLQEYQPEGVYHGCYSGGKDSDVIKALATMAGVRVAWNHNVTTIDPPELYRHIRRNHPDVVWHYPAEHFFRLLAEKRGYPLRTTRWCCEAYKEGHGNEPGTVKITGIRAAESPRRKADWREFTRWQPKGISASWMLNPILHWSDSDVWQFIREQELPYCELYDEGWKRLGCIGCPMGGSKQVRRAFARWPHHEAAWRRAFHRLWERRRDDIITRGKRKGRRWPGFPSITTADELFGWWVSGDSCPDKDEDDCQMGFF